MRNARSEIFLPNFGKHAQIIFRAPPEFQQGPGRWGVTIKMSSQFNLQSPSQVLRTSNNNKARASNTKSKETSRDTRLLLGIGDRHGLFWCDLEALQTRHGHAGLHVVFKFHESDARSGVDHSNLHEARKLLEEHAQHLFVGRLRKVLDEQDFMRRCCFLLGCWPLSLTSTINSISAITGMDAVNR